jgi:hypothetical protein
MIIKYFNPKIIISNLPKFQSFIYSGLLLVFSYFLSIIIFPSKGVDFSDEGHYLLSADSSETSDAWGWPYGWNLQFLFKISGYSIANFRILGFMILVLVNYRFATKFIKSWTNNKINSYSKIEILLYKIIITSSVFLFYAGYLRSPSYNWLNLVGLTIFLTGLIQLITIKHDQCVDVARAWGCKFEISIGMFIALPAKPSTLGFGLVAIFLSIKSTKNWKSALNYSFQIVLMVSILVLIAVGSQFWPKTLISQVFQALQMPALTKNHTFSGALLDVALTPITILKSILMFIDIRMLLATLFFLFFLAKFKKTNQEKLFLILFVGLVLSFSIRFWKLRDFKGSADQKQFWLENTLISNSFLVLIISFAIYQFIVFKSKNFGKKVVNYENYPTKIVYANIFISLMALGFGSSGGIFAKLTLGINFLTTVLVLQISSLIRNSVVRKLFVISLLCHIFVIQVIVFTGSYHNPYRSESLQKMKYPTKIGNHNTSILLDYGTSVKINSLRIAASSAGFTKTTPTINLGYPSQVGIGYALGGRQSPTIHFVWFGYANSLEQSKYLITRSESRFNFEDAWVLKSSDAQYGNEFDNFQEIIEFIYSKGAGEFPRDFVLVYKDSKIELWKPSLDKKAN